MPPVVKLNRNDLIEWIEAKEAGGGDATELRRALEALGPDQDSRARTRRHGSRFSNEEEPTTAERLNNRGVGDLFPDGLSDDLVARLVDLDRNHSLKELKAMSVEAGLSPGRDKKGRLPVSHCATWKVSALTSGPTVVQPLARTRTVPGGSFGYPAYSPRMWEHRGELA